MSRSCVCGGSNENCRYCSGRGEIPDRLANALTAHSRLPESRKVHVGSTRQLGKWMTVKDSKLSKLGTRIAKLNWVRATIFGKRLASSAPATPSASQSVLCPRGCGARINRQDVDRHVQQVHAPAPIKQREPRTAPSGSSPVEYEFCSACKVRVKASRMKRHLRKVHKKHSARLAANSSVLPSASDVLRETTTLVAPRDKNLDATKLYAHSYREQGRFGSHPSHDGFDDESGPE
jgi:hypothetical protein